MAVAGVARRRLASQRRGAARQGECHGGRGQDGAIRGIRFMRSAPGGSSMVTFVALALAAASMPGSRPRSSAASRLISDTMRNGPACRSTCAITPSRCTRVTSPTKRLRADARASGNASARAPARCQLLHERDELGPSITCMPFAAFRSVRRPCSPQRRTVSSLTPRRAAASLTRNSVTWIPHLRWHGSSLAVSAARIECVPQTATGSRWPCRHGTRTASTTVALRSSLSARPPWHSSPHRVVVASRPTRSRGTDSSRVSLGRRSCRASQTCVHASTGGSSSRSSTRSRTSSPKPESAAPGLGVLRTVASSSWSRRWRMTARRSPTRSSRTAAVVAPGLMVMGIILFMGKISGAHLHPAVTLAFSLRGDFPWRRVPGYIAVQLLGAACAGVGPPADHRRVRLVRLQLPRRRVLLVPGVPDGGAADARPRERDPGHRVGRRRTSA